MALYAVHFFRHTDLHNNHNRRSSSPLLRSSRLSMPVTMLMFHLGMFLTDYSRPRRSPHVVSMAATAIFTNLLLPISTLSPLLCC
ncbi:hypothetical protein FNV43_RR00119 [Rhamnella rubrinervis]|uniref:Uncharacterized protein n=1 Tax=Rhamnella rubrinervis TaxID=2594499 RepID=A0A8K0HPR9_9ROSA|nr:hypothetical protein FNV43_RR00119 [Rhamnella rubrinervis]